MHACFFGNGREALISLLKLCEGEKAVVHHHLRSPYVNLFCKVMTVQSLESCLLELAPNKTAATQKAKINQSPLLHLSYPSINIAATS
jgi:hypothetical protein